MYKILLLMLLPCIAFAKRSQLVGGIEEKSYEGLLQGGSEEPICKGLDQGIKKIREEENGNYKFGCVTAASSQVVSGISYKIHVTVEEGDGSNTNACPSLRSCGPGDNAAASRYEVEIWSQPWISPEPRVTVKKIQ